MEKNTGIVEKSEETGAESQGSGKSTGFKNVKNIIADQLHNVAETLGEKAADQGTQSVMAQYKNLASEWLDQSAEYIWQFECKQAGADFSVCAGRCE